MADTTTLVLPEWTEAGETAGLDPLGMQNSGILLYQALLPGISNVTLRVRYYGLYAWLSWAYGRRIGDTTTKSWQRFVRRAEALYALIAFHRGGETGVAGIQWAQRRLESRSGASIAFAEDAEPGSPTYYLRQSWGAYGAAYASQLFEAGVFSSAEEHDLPVPSAELGERLALAVVDEFGQGGDLFLEAVMRGDVSVAQLETLAPVTPSGIRTDSGERQLYEDLLFANAGLARAPDLQRRQTLLLILDLTRQLGRMPTVNEVRWAFYAQRDRDGRALAFSTTELAAHRRRWSVYHLNDLAHVCFETLMKFTLDTLRLDYPNGAPLDRLLGAMVAKIMAAMPPAGADWEHVLAAVPAPDNAWDSRSGDTEFALSEDLMRVGRSESVCDGEGAWAALRLLAIVHQRARNARDDINAAFSELRPDAFRSLLTELRFLDQHATLAFPQFVARLIEERVIRRHLWIALRKLHHQSDYTFLMETDDGRVRYRTTAGPVFTNPRLGPALGFLSDIHLLASDGLTAQGRRLLESA